MVNYKCPRCGFNNIIKTKYIQHLKRQYICTPLINDIDLNDEYIKYNITDKIIDNKPNISQKSAFSKSNVSQNKPKKYECEYCKKKYNHKQSLHKHLKTCKEKIKDDECRNDMLELIKKLNEQLEKKDNEFKKQLEKKDKQIEELIKKTGITQNIQNNNIQNNIKILAYKNTDISHLTDNDFIYCFNRSNMCIPHLIKKIHFNPKKPENNNVYISNIKNKYIMVYDGNKWNLHNQNETIEDLIDTNEVVLEQKLEEWLENGKEYPEIMKKFNRYLEKKEKDEVINTIKEEIRLILFNNRIIKEEKI